MIYKFETDDKILEIKSSKRKVAANNSGIKKFGSNYFKCCRNLIKVLVLTLLCAVNANAQTSGTTGSCTWELTGTAPNLTLTISGNGAMANYNATNSPWYSVRASITTVSIGNGVTKIGEYAFIGTNIASVTIPTNVTNQTN